MRRVRKNVPCWLCLEYGVQVCVRYGPHQGEAVERFRDVTVPRRSWFVVLDSHSCYLVTDALFFLARSGVMTPMIWCKDHPFTAAERTVWNLGEKDPITKVVRSKSPLSRSRISLSVCYQSLDCAASVCSSFQDGATRHEFPASPFRSSNRASRYPCARSSCDTRSVRWYVIVPAVEASEWSGTNMNFLDRFRSG